MGLRHHGYREISRSDWGRKHHEDEPLNKSFDADSIKLGCLLRIADATEAMAKNYVNLQRDYERAQQEVKRLTANNNRMGRSIAALRGHIGRLKRAV